MNSIIVLRNYYIHHNTFPKIGFETQSKAVDNTKNFDATVEKVILPECLKEIVSMILSTISEHQKKLDDTAVTRIIFYPFRVISKNQLKKIGKIQAMLLSDE